MNAMASATIDSGAEDLMAGEALRVVDKNDNQRDAMARSVSRSFSLSRGKSNFMNLNDEDVGGSGVLRRSVTDYAHEANALPTVAYSRTGGVMADSPVLRSRQPTSGSQGADLANTDSLLYSQSSSSRQLSRASRYSGEQDERGDEEEDDDLYAHSDRTFNKQEHRSSDRATGRSIDMRDSLEPHDDLSDGEPRFVRRGAVNDDDEEDSVDLLQTVDSNGDNLVGRFAPNPHAVANHADLYEREAASNHRARGNTTPPAKNYDQPSPNSKSDPRYKQRTFSNVSKASTVSIFRGLPVAGDSEDGSVNSLALSDSNNFDEMDNEDDV